MEDETLYKFAEMHIGVRGEVLGGEDDTLP